MFILEKGRARAFIAKQRVAAESRLLSRRRFLRRALDSERLAARRLGGGVQRLPAARARAGGGARPEAAVTRNSASSWRSGSRNIRRKRRRAFRSISRPRCSRRKSATHDKVALDETAAKRERRRRGAVRGRGRALPQKQKAHPQNRSDRADRRDGLRRGQPRDDLPAFRAQSQPRAHPAALSHLDRRHESESALPRRDRARARRARAQGLAAQSRR